MLKFLIDNIFVMFDGRIFHQTVGIPMDTNGSSRLLVSLVIQGRLYTGASQEKRKDASPIL